MIKGITVTLYNRTQTGTDGMNMPVYTETAETVQNVLVAPVSGAEITDALTLHGAKIVYQLGIPKGDAHEWHDRTVEFFGRKWHTVGDVTEGVESLIPLNWNRKINVEAYNG